MLEGVATPEAWTAPGAQLSIELVPGIDDIVFISIPVGRLALLFNIVRVMSLVCSLDSDMTAVGLAFLPGGILYLAFT